MEIEKSIEVKLVHPSDPDKKVITATDEQQVAAYRNHGFIEEAELEDQKNVAEADSSASEELTKLKAENKALKSENTKLKNKLEKTSNETSVPDGSEQEDAQQSDIPVDGEASKSEEETK
jgi:regulator of replication initiation timing